MQNDGQFPHHRHHRLLPAAALAALGPERGAAELCRLLDAHAGAKGDLAVAYVSELVLAVRRA